MSSANFKLKRTAAASRGFLATARFSCFSSWYPAQLLAIRLIQSMDSAVEKCSWSSSQPFAVHMMSSSSVICAWLSTNSALEPNNSLGAKGCWQILRYLISCEIW